MSGIRDREKEGDDKERTSARVTEFAGVKNSYTIVSLRRVLFLINEW